MFLKVQKKLLVIILIAIIVGITLFYVHEKSLYASAANLAETTQSDTSTTQQVQHATQSYSQNPLSIVFMRQQSYPGSDLKIEQNLQPGKNYNQYIVSYLSQNFKIYALLTVPQGNMPPHGWPVIIFNHGFIRPANYKTTGNYELYVSALASSGYIVLKPDYRGNGNSESMPDSTYFSPSYTIDELNAIATIKKYAYADPKKIGLWGHSDAGDLILRTLVVDTKDIQAAVIWGGVMAPYSELTSDWQSQVSYQQAASDLKLENNHMQNLIDTYGTPAKNPEFWNTIDPINYLKDITTPMQLDTGGADEQVPIHFSVNIKNELEALGKKVIYYNYPGLNHNISEHNIPHQTAPYPQAMQNTISFFDTYLK